MKSYSKDKLMLEFAMIKVLSFLLFFISIPVYSITICDQFPEYCTNLKRNQSRPVNSSLPTQSSAVFNNPAAVNTDRGFGIESIHYKGDAQLGLVTGTGRVGAAISNNPSEETFFGNGVQEDTLTYRERWFEKDQYKSEKFILSTAVNLFGKKRRKGLQMDLGINYRYINDIKSSFLGGGLALNWSRIISASYAEFRDAYVKDLRGKTITYYEVDGSKSTFTYPQDNIYLFQKHFQVKNYTLGFNYSNWSFDYSWFTTTNLDDNTKSYVKIFNSSLFYKKWMFSFGTREEESQREYFDPKKEEMITQKFKYNIFIGAQYALGKHFVIGLFNNYYLLNEWSLGLTFFF